MTGKMSEQDHIQGVGAIITNFLALETVIRLFLANLHGQKPRLPAAGDQSAEKNYLTNFLSLGGLIDEYNAGLSDQESELKVDRVLVDVRNAFAHGRLLSVGDVYPATLYKFGIARNGSVPIECQLVLSQDWLAHMKLRIRGEQDKVIRCFKARGFRGF
jgi:hypothetical protein